ncbi:hypothetical protein JW930_01140 [Candidatus Woesearchaeota archaeon]|nr:hypothetical protein [Candidatus Woesearchaeota archaeon]
MDDFQNVFYKALIISLVLGVFISIGFLYLTKPEASYFSELYYLDQENLPNQIELDRNYNFAYEINSRENKTETYEYETVVELFRIYDISEGNYDCFSEFREKLYYQWLPANESNYSIIGVMQKDDLYNDFYTVQDTDYNNREIKEEEYSLYLEYESGYGMGQFNIVFGNGTSRKFALILSESDNTTYFIFWNSTINTTVTKVVNLTGDDKHIVEIRINQGRFSVFVDSNLVLSQDSLYFSDRIPDYTGGRFTLESRNSYYSIRRMQLYPGGKAIDVLLQGNKLLDYQRKISEMRSDYIDIVSKGISEKHGYNTSLKYFLNISSPSEISVTGHEFGELNITSQVSEHDEGVYPLIYQWADIEYELSSYPTNVFETTENSPINFTNFTLSFDFQTSYGEQQLMLYFYDQDNNTKYSFLVNQQKHALFFLEYTPDAIKVTYKKHQLNTLPHTVLMNFTESNLDIIIDKKPVLHLDNITSIFSDISFEAKNTYIYIDDIRIVNRDPNCDSKTFLGKCLKSYRTDTRRGVSVYQEVDVGFKETLIRNISADEQLVLDLPLPPLAKTDESVMQEYNPYIKDTSFMFNGPSARLQAMSNYTFSMNYLTLEGLGVVSVGFKDINDSDAFKLVLSDKTDEALLITKTVNRTIQSNLTEGEWNIIQINYNNGITKLIQDYNTELFVTNKLNLSNGYFFITTQNTYANFRGVQLRDNSLNLIRRYNLEENPCEMRLIFEKILDKREIVLYPNEKYTAHNNFTINTSFDFGKITTNLLNKNQSIHFWLKR